MTVVAESVSWEDHLFFNSCSESITLPSLSLHILRKQKDECQALNILNQSQRKRIAKLEKEVESMRTILIESKQFKLTKLEKKSYLQTYLSRLTKTTLMKEVELLRLTKQTDCSLKDKTKVLQEKRLRSMFEHLFRVRICTKYSDSDTIYLIVTKQTEGTSSKSVSKKNENDKENYVQIDNSAEQSWSLLEKMNRLTIKEMSLLRNT